MWYPPAEILVADAVINPDSGIVTVAKNAVIQTLFGATIIADDLTEYHIFTNATVDIKSAHPFWGYPFSDVSVVHNGQLTNYWNNRRALERKGMRFMSSCDSELIAVYLANKIRDGKELEDAMQSSLIDLDGVFTYMVATKDKLGMAKDHMAAKPMVLYESDELVALASEEVAIRSLLPHEIDTYDPYEGEVKVWQA